MIEALVALDDTIVQYAEYTQSPDDIIVVEATRLGQTRAEAGTPIAVIDRESLERLGYPLVSDAIATAPGVSVNQTGALGGATSVRVRGGASDQTLVLIDGIPVGDTSAPGGAFDFARLDTEQIERIEILRGAQSTLWGSEAIGGVVAITTRAPGNGISGFAEAGSFGTARGGVSASYRGKADALRIAASGTTSSGFSKADEDAGNTEDDGYRSQTLSLRYRRSLGSLALDASLLAQSAETEFDSFDFSAPGFVADGDERAETDELTAHLALDSDAKGTQTVRHRITGGYSSIDRRNYADGVPSFDSEGSRTTLRYDAAVQPKAAAWKIVLGAERDGRDSRDGSTHILSGFALGEWKPSDALTLTGGIRVDDHAEFGSETTGRLAAAYVVGRNLTLRANWGQGFKAPSLFQQTFFCCGAAGPNLDLQPERSEGYDIGALWTIGTLRFETGYFAVSTDDLIDFSFASGGYSNIAKAERRGVETTAEIPLMPGANLRASYTWLDAEDGDGNTLARLPEHAGTASLDWRRDRLSGALLLRYNGAEEDNFGTVDAWTRLDAVFNVDVKGPLQFFARIANVTDADYQEVFGYGTAGRSGTIGLRLNQ